jgi:hypothetical protein
MLINEFDLKLGDKDEFLKDKPSENDFLRTKFYWLQVRDNVNTDRATHLVLLSKRHQKGIYKIMPNFELVI